MSEFNNRVRDAARAASCWKHERPFENFILCVPWIDELALLNEMTEGLHGEHARTVAYIDGAAAFSRWEGFPVAWGTETFGIVEIKNASSDVLTRVLRAQLALSAFRPLMRKDLSGENPLIKVRSPQEQNEDLKAAAAASSLKS
jgi:hypothetical protein